MLAAGTVWGFCGYATGVGTAGIIDLSGGKDTITVGFHLTFVGTTVVVSGGNADTNLHGELAAAASTGSCVDTTTATASTRAFPRDGPTSTAPGSRGSSSRSPACPTVDMDTANHVYETDEVHNRVEVIVEFTTNPDTATIVSHRWP